MRIALFSPVPYSKKLGATKNRIELAESLSKIGWETFLIGYEELGLTAQKKDESLYREALKNYLIKYAHLYEVVLYEYDTLPFDRKLFSKTTLFVARPALLHFNKRNIKIPVNSRTKISGYYNKILKILGLKKGLADKDIDYRRLRSLSECDVIQVQNEPDALLLTEKGYSREKIIVVPNGISEERIKLFDNIEKKYTPPFTIAFVGTFDFRKGAMDFPYIVSEILKYYPNCKFKLLGTKGLFTTEKEVLAFFSKSQRAKISIIPVFEPKNLPYLLNDCQLGIFPSYFESFGFGALEMMAAGLPVVAYNSSGPSDFILNDLLVPIGDKEMLSKKVIALLSDHERLKLVAKEVKEVVKGYNWDNIAERTAEIYTERRRNLLNR